MKALKTHVRLRSTTISSAVKSLKTSGCHKQLGSLKRARKPLLLREPRSYSPNAFLKGKRNRFHINGQKSGVRLYRPCRNNVVLLHETHNLLMNLYQQCWYSFTKAEIVVSKIWLRRIRKHFDLWSDVYAECRTVKRFLQMSSLVLRVAENGTKYPGRSLSESLPPMVDSR